MYYEKKSVLSVFNEDFIRMNRERIIKESFFESDR